MDSPKEHVSTMVLVSLLLSVLLYSYVAIPTLSPFLQKASSNKTSIFPKDELEAALGRASMKNKTVIIAVVNKAYTKQGSMLDLFLQSFKLGKNIKFLLNHLLLVAVDQTAFDRCIILHLHCYKLMTDGVDFSGEKIYMSYDFIKMTWRRTLFLADVLRRGYSFIFTDMDVMWLRNPFVRLNQGGEDLQISCDVFNGQPWNISNLINTGFYYIASNNKTTALFDTWYARRNKFVGMKEQDVLGWLIHKGVFQRLNLRIRFLDTLYFGGFCESGKDFRKVITMHANCCRTIKAKVMDLRALLHGWTNFRQSSSSNASSTVQWPLYNGCYNSWRINPNQTSNSTL